MCDIDFLAGPFSLKLHRIDAEGTAIGRFEKGVILSDKIFRAVLAMGADKKTAHNACVRINMLLESEMSALIASPNLLQLFCETRLDTIKNEKSSGALPNLLGVAPLLP